MMKTFYRDTMNNECINDFQFASFIRQDITKANEDFETYSLAIHSGMKMNLIHQLEQGMNFFQYACFTNNKDIVSVCLEYASSRSQLLLTMLNNAVMHLRHDCEINLKSLDGMTPLMYACRGNNRDIVRMLLKKNVDTHVRDQYGDHAMHFGDIDTKIVLVKHDVFDVRTMSKYPLLSLFYLKNMNHHVAQIVYDQLILK